MSRAGGDELLERRIYFNMLYDLYSPLLTERQRDVYERLSFSDFTQAEIARDLEISRQAVHILIGRITDRLESIEKSLGFAATVKGLEERIKELELKLESLELQIKKESSGSMKDV